MATNRAQFAEAFLHLPRWTCPTCMSGHLITNNSKMLIDETGPSKRRHERHDWDPDEISRRVAGLLVCDHSNCGEVVAFAGHQSVQEEVSHDEDGTPSPEWVDLFHVTYLNPAPHPIAIPPKTPLTVEETLKQAFVQLWQSAEAAANTIRQAVEHLLDYKGVRKRILVTGGPGGANRWKRLTLHARIDAFKATDPKVAEVLLAVKWLGNSGSHAGGLNRKDVLDALEMMEHALSLMFVKPDKIMKTVRGVNRRRGPIK